MKKLFLLKITLVAMTSLVVNAFAEDSATDKRTYRLICDSRLAGSLDEQVTQMREMGWRLYGDPAISCARGCKYCQAVIK